MLNDARNAIAVCRNAMELLVAEEVQRQFQNGHPRTRIYLNPIQMRAYALNQLPALYATTEKGLTYQLQRGKAQYAPEIERAVKRALAAVMRDPLQHSTPLQK